MITVIKDTTNHNEKVTLTQQIKDFFLHLLATLYRALYSKRQEPEHKHLNSLDHNAQKKITFFLDRGRKVYFHCRTDIRSLTT